MEDEEYIRADANDNLHQLRLCCSRLFVFANQLGGDNFRMDF